MTRSHIPAGTTRRSMPKVGDVLIDLRLHHRLGSESDVQVWSATYLLEDGDDDAEPEVMGQAVLYLADLDGDWWMQLEEEASTVARVAEAVYSALEEHPGDEQLEHYSAGLLIADSLELQPHWRGLGLGPLLLTETLQQLSIGAGLFACYPGPLRQAHQLDADTFAATFDDGQQRLRTTWAMVGFEPLHGHEDTFIMNGNDTRRTEHLHKLRRQHGDDLD